MARNRVEYEIRAQDKTGKPTRDARKNIDKTSKSFKDFGKILKRGLALGGATVAFKKIADAVNQVSEAYSKQQDAEIKLATAVANNPLLDRGATSRLQEFASELQQITTVGDEVAISMAGMLGSFGRSEDEIRDIIVAANDLSSATGITLDSAVRNLNRTYGGMTGEIGELIPELRDLTKEQLESGAAVELVSEKFAGMGEAAAQGLSGVKAQFDNAKGDLEESLGSVLAPIQTRMFSKLADGFRDFTGWLNDNAGNIYAVFTNIVPIMRESLTLIGRLMIELFTGDTLVNTIASFADFFWNHFKIKIQFIGQMFGALFDSVREAQDTFGADAGKAFWESYMNAFFTLPRTLLKLGARVFGIDRDFRFEFDGHDTNFGEVLLDNIKGKAGEIQAALTNAVSGAGANAANLGESLAAEFGGPVRQWQEAINSILEEGREEWTEYNNKMQDAGGKVEDLGNKAGSAASAISGGESLTAGPTGDAVGGFDEGDGGDGVSSDRARKSIGDVVGKLEGVGAAAGKVAQSMDLQGQAIQSVMALLDAFMGGFASVMGPIVNDILPVYHGIMNVIGEMWATFMLPKMAMLTELLELLGKGFVWFYNQVIQPVGAKFLEIAKKIAKAFDRVINGIIDGLNSIKILGLDIPNIDASGRIPSAPGKITFDELKERGEETAPTFDIGGGGGGPERVGDITSGRKINVKVNINTDVIAGEGGIRDLAIMIRDEIRAAEALGA